MADNSTHLFNALNVAGRRRANEEYSRRLQAYFDVFRKDSLSDDLDDLFWKESVELTFNKPYFRRA